MIELGWSTIAWNTSVFGKLVDDTARPVKLVNLDEAQLAKAFQLRSVAYKSTNTSFRQFTRITIAVDELNDAQAIHSRLISSFSIQK
jgi:hypothetical protein